MNNTCIYIRKRKKGVYCAKIKAYIDFKECSSCLSKEYKKVSKNALKMRNRTSLKKVSKTSKIVKATSISTRVKKIVWERDKGVCIFCNKPVEWNLANSHYIKRSHLGLGIEENIFTACLECHHKFDDTPLREEMLPIAEEYLSSKYKDWSKDKLVYKKN